MAHLLLHPDWLWRTSRYTPTNYGTPSTTPWPTMAHLLPHPGQLWRTFYHTLANYGAPPATVTTPWLTMAHLLLHLGQLWRTSRHTLTNYGAPPVTPWPTMAHLLSHPCQLWHTSYHILSLCHISCPWTHYLRENIKTAKLLLCNYIVLNGPNACDITNRVVSKMWRILEP